MRSLALNGRDMYAVGGQLAIASGLDAVQVGCETVMRTLIGEMIFNVDEGQPYMGDAWEEYDPAKFETASRISLLSVPNVLRVDTFTAVLTGDVLKYTASIVSTFGATEITNNA